MCLVIPRRSLVLNVLIIAGTISITKNKDYLDLGKNIEPSMKTDPDRRMYQHVDSSPVLKRNIFYHNLNVSIIK